MVAVEMVFDLLYCFYYLFKTERARKMQFLPLQRNMNVDSLSKVGGIEAKILHKTWEERETKFGQVIAVKWRTH